MNTSDIKDLLEYKYNNNIIRNNGTIDIQNCHFICDKPYIVSGVSCDFDMQWYVENYVPIIEENQQIEEVVNKIIEDRNTRQAVICMANPKEHKSGGYICTMYMQTFLNDDNHLKWIVNMRSNSVERFPVDYKFQETMFGFVARQLAERLNESIICDPIEWNVGSMHIYEKSFHLLDKK